MRRVNRSNRGWVLAEIQMWILSNVNHANYERTAFDVANRHIKILSKLLLLPRGLKHNREPVTIPWNRRPQRCLEKGFLRSLNQLFHRGSSTGAASCLESRLYKTGGSLRISSRLTSWILEVFKHDMMRINLYVNMVLMNQLSRCYIQAFQKNQVRIEMLWHCDRGGGEGKIFALSGFTLGGMYNTDSWILEKAEFMSARLPNAEPQRLHYHTIISSMYNTSVPADICILISLLRHRTVTESLISACIFTLRS